MWFDARHKKGVFYTFLVNIIRYSNESVSYFSVIDKINNTYNIILVANLITTFLGLQNKKGFQEIKTNQEGIPIAVITNHYQCLRPSIRVLNRPRRHISAEKAENVKNPRK